jgi:pimeloyl-ACP methyl ester carboxylesterase
MGSHRSGKASIEGPSIADRLPKIACPTTVLVGGESFLFEAGRKMESLIPGAQFVSVSGAGHVIQESHPDPWLAAVRDHLARVRDDSKRRATSSR